MEGQNNKQPGVVEAEDKGLGLRSHYQPTKEALANLGNEEQLVLDWWQ